MDKPRITAVSYTNTKPFLYGIKHSGLINNIDLSLDPPAECAQKLIDNRADIGLIPVAAILQLPKWHIISDYCIGAVGAVNSVFIFSNCPIQKVERLQMDPQSRSSNNLAKVLLKNYWHINPELTIDAADYAMSADPNTAFVQIGDRTFGKKDDYPFTYDLAEEWTNFTGLPFVFAAWIANKPIDVKFTNRFNSALQYGLAHRKELFKELPAYKNFDVEDYLMNKIDFPFTEQKRQALHLFHKHINEL